MKKIYGIDIVPKYKEESLVLALDKKLIGRFEFVLADVSNLPFEDGIFDTIVMNDATEHLSKPVEVLNECHRILKSKGRCILFSTLLSLLWCSFKRFDRYSLGTDFFDDDTLIGVYKDLAKNLLDGEESVKLRVSRDEEDKELFSYINKMTIKKFKFIYPNTKLSLVYYREVPLRNFLNLFVKIPVLKEVFTKMMVAIFKK